MPSCPTKVSVHSRDIFCGLRFIDKPCFPYCTGSLLQHKRDLLREKDLRYQNNLGGSCESPASSNRNYCSSHWIFSFVLVTVYSCECLRCSRWSDGSSHFNTANPLARICEHGGQSIAIVAYAKQHMFCSKIVINKKTRFFNINSKYNFCCIIHMFMCMDFHIH